MEKYADITLSITLPLLIILNIINLVLNTQSPPVWLRGIVLVLLVVTATMRFTRAIKERKDK